MTDCGRQTLRGWLVRDSIGDTFDCGAKATLAIALSGFSPAPLSLLTFDLRCYEPASRSRLKILRGTFYRSG